MKTATEIATDITRRYNEEEFAPGESELDMVHAAVKTAIEESRGGNLYLVQYNIEREGYYGRSWDEVPDLDLGYFLTKEAAQAEADRLNNYEAKWDAYVRKVTAENARAMKTFAQRQNDHEKAKAAGLAHLAPAPVRAAVKPVLDFEDWKSTLREDSFYDVVEVEPHAVP